MVKKLAHSDDDVKRYIGALSEDFSDKVKIIGEQYIGLRKHLDKRFDQIDKKLDSHTEMIGNLAVDAETLKDDMKVVKSDLQIIKTDVEPRVAHLEAGSASRD